MNLDYLPPGARAIRLADGPKLSVVVASSRGRERLAACLAALEHQCLQHDAEIVVAHALRPGDLADLARRHPEVHWVGAEPQADVFRLRGLGLAAARGDIVALTEDHLVVGPSWLGQLLERTASGATQPGAVGPAQGPAASRGLRWAW